MSTFFVIATFVLIILLAMAFLISCASRIGAEERGVQKQSRTAQRPKKEPMCDPNSTEELDELYESLGFLGERVQVDISQKEFSDQALPPPEFYFKMILNRPDTYPIVSIPKSLLDSWKKAMSEKIHFESVLMETTSNNNLGMESERSGNIDEAIAYYEKNIEIGYPATHSYERLRILYRRRHDIQNELRVLRAGVALFEQKNNDRFIQALSEYPQLEEEIRNARCNPKKGTLRDGDGSLVVSFIVEEAKYRLRIKSILERNPELMYPHD